MLIRLLSVVYCVVLVLLAGCSTTDVAQSPGQSSQLIPVTITETKDISIERANAHISHDQLAVTGIIQRDRLLGSNYHGHVDVTLADANNQVLLQVKSPYAVGCLIPDGLRRTRFSLTVPIHWAISAPVQVHVKVHREPDCTLKAVNS